MDNGSERELETAEAHVRTDVLLSDSRVWNARFVNLSSCEFHFVVRTFDFANDTTSRFAAAKR